MDIFIGVGNSDDKLTQREWADYHREVDLAVHARLAAGATVHGHWLSDPAAPWQNACWCIEAKPSVAYKLKADLAVIAGRYRQDSIAWSEATTEFIAGVPNARPVLPSRLPT